MSKIILFVLLVLSSISMAKDRLNPSVFLVTNPLYNWLGTAFKLQTDRGPVTITNHHVCDENNLMVANFMKEKKVKLLTVKKVSNKYDLCILSPVPDLPVLYLAETYTAGDSALVDGFPLGHRMLSYGQVGKFIPFGNVYTPQVIVEFSGDVNNGNSGSPVLDSQGKVIGVINSKGGEVGIPSPGYFVPLEALKDFLEEAGYN